MRGKVTLLYALADKEGITPAYAGKRSSHAPRACIYRDHPRVCGEKYGSSDMNIRIAGSPPRMRGKGLTNLTFANDDRITPAYAGKSACKSHTCTAYWDHPRVCGEKTKKIP